MFTSKLSWKKTRDVLSKQALEAFKLFDIFVLPILCYSSEIWGYDYSESIEKVHADLCKRVCCLHQNICNFLAISECVRTPISIVYMSGCVKYWAMLTQMQTHRYPKQCYNMLRTLDNVGVSLQTTSVSHRVWLRLYC